MFKFKEKITLAALIKSAKFSDNPKTNAALQRKLAIDNAEQHWNEHHSEVTHFYQFKDGSVATFKGE